MTHQEQRSVMLGAAYGPALVVGLIMIAILLPAPMLLGTGGLWSAPGGDVAQNLTGHLALQATAWGIPPLVAQNLMPPHGISIAMTDSNPLMSLLAKLLARPAPINLLGIWLAACWILQPIAGVYALRGLAPTSRWDACLAAAVLTAVFPALLFRVGHINLCAHFILLVAIGLAARRRTTVRWADWLAPCGLLAMAILVHPYLFVFSAALLATPWLQAAIEWRPGHVRAFIGFAVAAVLPVALFLALSGTLGGGAKGYGFYSMNLLSPIWPARSALLGPDLPLQDATGGQYEGYNYLGVGGLTLMLVSTALLVWRRPHLMPWRGMIAGLTALALISLSTKVYLGQHLLLSLGVRPWDQIFGPIQSTGRAFWPVGLSLLLAGVATVSSRLPRWITAPLLAAVCLVQWIDTGRLRADAEHFYAGDFPNPPPVAIPTGATLLSTVPVCVASDLANNQAAALRLAAVRAGLRLADIKLSRPPNWFNCEKTLSDGLELPLVTGEMRVFLDLAGLPVLRPALLGAATQCGTRPGLVVCTNGVVAPDGTPLGPGPAIPILSSAAHLAEAELTPLLGIGWRQDGAGVPWSEGPRSTLIFRVPQGLAHLRMTLAGISRRPGAPHDVGVSVGTGAPQMVALPDLTPMTIDLDLSSDQDGIVRIAFDSDHPVPPQDRALPTPVNRASLRLLSLEVRVDETLQNR